MYVGLHVLPFSILMVVKLAKLQCLIRLALDFRGFPLLYFFSKSHCILFSVLMCSMKPLKFSQPQQTEFHPVTSCHKAGNSTGSKG